jgi:hypothetical protein
MIETKTKQYKTKQTTKTNEFGRDREVPWSSAIQAAPPPCSDRAASRTASESEIENEIFTETMNE